jgi:acetate kinase
MTAGSTSLKFVAYEATPAGPQRRLHGAVESIGEPEARLRLNSNDGNPMHDSRFPVSDHAEALAALAELRDGPFSLGGLVGFGHRVVHGGPDYGAPVHLDAATIAHIEALQSLAPLHNTPAVAVIKTLAERYPGVPQVACFDTAFHRTHPAVADRYAIPDALYQDGVRRYGFHGLSYEYIAGRLNDVAPSVALGRVVVAHLGAGASMCALAGGRSMDSSMGFSAVDGLPMGTRSGSVDPYLLLWLQQTKCWSLETIDDFLQRECGLLGLSGISSDMATLPESDEPAAKLAVDYFVYHVCRFTGALAAAMGGIDAMVFTASIGEHSAPVRSRVLQRLGFLGFVLDEAANEAGGPLLTRPGSRCPAYVIPTDQEIVIARHTLALIGNGTA